jgi:PKD repeat protein
MSVWYSLTPLVRLPRTRTTTRLAALAAVATLFAVGAETAAAAVCPDPTGAPTASFTYSPPSPSAGQSVSFDGQGSASSYIRHYYVQEPVFGPDPGGSGGMVLIGYRCTQASAVGTIASYSWDFGDGSSGTGSTASHAFAAPGTYTVTLTVTGNLGGTDTESHQVTVAAPSTGDGDEASTPTTTNDPVTTTGGTGDTSTGETTQSSNEFSFETRTSSSNGTASLTVDVPGPGTLGLVATANVSGTAARAGRTIKVARLTRSVAAAGPVNLTIKPSRVARRVLARKGKLRARVKLTYTPTGGTASTQTRTVTLKLKRRGS